MQWIYLDNNATTRPADDVAAAMREMDEQFWANPSSVHRFGQSVRQKLELARQEVASLVGGRPRELIFTSGGTESDNLAIYGTLEATLRPEGGPPGALITSAVEHSAVREPVADYEQAGGRVEQVRVDRAGRVETDAVRDALARHADEGRPILVSIQWANNETGTIQPIAAVAAAVAEAKQTAAERRPRIWLHIDATQAVGKLPVNVRESGADLVTFSAHKLHGPKGVGALWVRPGVRIRPLLRGGPQERERRGGTENAAGIVGFGVAAKLAAAFLEDPARRAEIEALRDRLEAKIAEAVPEMRVNAREAERLWNTSNLAFPGLEAEAILLGLSERGVCASAGAACSSGSLEPSPVLRAMGIDEPTAHGSVRFSLSRETTAEEIDQAAEAVAEVVQRGGRTMPVGR
ncbi:MAG: cysteine desulfurase family protein [Phycisphaeraceae bacterium]